MKILFLSGWFPYPAVNGSKIRILNLLSILAKNHRVTLISFYRSPEELKNIPILESMCEKVYVVPWKEYQPGSLKAIMGFLGPKPRSLVDIHSRSMKQLVQEEIQKPYDGLICSELYMADYLPHSLAIPALWEDVELGSSYDAMARTKNKRLQFRNFLAWKKNSHYIRSRSKLFRACTVVSEKEQSLFQMACPSFKHVEVIPNCIDVQTYAGVNKNPEPNTIIFTGSITFSANYESLVNFAKNILPIIQLSEPEIKLTVTGNTGDITLPSDISQTGITFTGHVPDIKPILARHTASVVPILSGGGTRLKILEAFALGIPVISTSKGAEGLSVTSVKHLLIADQPSDFAEAVINVIHDPALRERLIENAHQLVLEKYNWSIVSEKFLEIVENLTKLETDPCK